MLELYQLIFSLERPHPSEEMIENMKSIEKVFSDLIKDKEALHEIIFSWICLMNGAISIMMKFPDLPNQKGKDPRQGRCPTGAKNRIRRLLLRIACYLQDPETEDKGTGRSIGPGIFENQKILSQRRRALYDFSRPPPL